MTQSRYDISKETIKRAEFFQTVHAWPLDDELNYKGWLENFKTDYELELACLILDFFIYYPDKMINKMLRTSISQAGYYLSKTLGDWKHDNFFNRCVYSFIPGETQNPSDSGRIFLRKIRDTLEIPEERFIEYANIPIILDKIGKPTPVIFVDDFVGSGAQCVRAWNTNRFRYNGKTLKEMSETDGHIFIYSPLVVNNMGYERIKTQCDRLTLTATHVLGNEYNLFNKDCFCWKNDGALFKDGTDLIIRKSKELGIPFSGTQNALGFGNQGLAIAFAHSVPDAIPSFFYWCHENWTPLLNKTYKR